MIEQPTPTKLSKVDLTPPGSVHPSPLSWRDQFIFALLPDRFSDGREHERPLFDRARPEQYLAQDRRAWQEAGTKFQGGNLAGIASKLDYLQDLGVTTLLIAPAYSQRADLQTYHAYGIQNFLDIDPRFGTRQDLRNLVQAAHERGMYVLLDVVPNHTGNNWFYDDNGVPTPGLPYRFQPPYPLHGWRSGQGTSVKKIATLDDGVWPREFQDPDWYVRAGHIGRWEPEAWEDPLHPDNEFRRGDFFELKKLYLDRPDVLSAVIRVYQYWIALSDCDGFRIDSLKHMSWYASRSFCGAIREYTESIGKENFLLVGDVTGGAGMIQYYVDFWGRNIDAHLDIGDPSTRLAGMVKGFNDPGEYFGQFSPRDILGDQRDTGRHHLSVLDDHDMVGRPGKHRFSAHNTIPQRYVQVAHAVGVQLTSLGIPTMYYGTEQAFDGTQDRHDPTVDSAFEDRYIRESMFGGTFGAFGTTGCHFFDPNHPTYLRIAAIARIRQQHDKIGRALRRGRQYLRQTSFLGRPFGVPGRGELVAWSRVLHDQEVLVALNTRGTQGRGADVTVDGALHPPGSTMTLLYRGDWADAELRNPSRNQRIAVERRGHRATVRIDLPPAGMAILA